MKILMTLVAAIRAITVTFVAGFVLGFSAGHEGEHATVPPALSSMATPSAFRTNEEVVRIMHSHTAASARRASAA